jgi:hypothetical protein
VTAPTCLAEASGHFKVQGPLFYQFVPDNQNDAVYLTPEHELHEIQVWFERRAKSRVDFCTGIAMERSLMKRSCAGRPFFRVEASEARC